MSIEAIIIISGGLVVGVAGAIYARWSRWRLERDDHHRPAE